MRILMIEDQPAYSRLVREYLRDCGDSSYELVVGVSLEKGLESLAGAAFDVILLDLNLPDSHGLNTLDRLLQNAVDTPIIVLTGQDDEKLADDALLRGAQDYLCKNEVSPALLKRVIRYAVQRGVWVVEQKRQREKLEQLVQERTKALRHANSKLLASRKKYKDLFDSAGDAVFVHDLKGRFLDVNKVACDRLGYTRDDLLCLSPDKIKDPEQDFNTKTVIRHIVEQGQAVFETVHMTKDGRQIPVEISSRLVMYDGQEAILSLARDISERKAFEKQLESRQQEKLKEQRLHALGQMASGVVHDINNALSPIVGYTDILLNKEGFGDKERNYLKMISTAGKDIASIASRMREFYRKRDEQQQFFPSSIQSLFDQVVELTRPRWKDMAMETGRMIIVETDVAEGLPALVGIESEIREALVNLILNATDALPEGGTILLKAEQRNGDIVLSVSDTGIGMDEETKRQCLEPFFTTKGDQGTGLGLGMVYGVMQRHEGKIEIVSIPGKGTTMELVFPPKEYRGQSVLREVEGKGFCGPRNLRILCIDDEASIRNLITDMLSSEGHEVTTATGGKRGSGFSAAPKLPAPPTTW